MMVVGHLDINLEGGFLHEVPETAGCDMGRTTSKDEQISQAPLVHDA